MWLQVINQVKATHQGEGHIKVKVEIFFLSNFMYNFTYFKILILCMWLWISQGILGQILENIRSEQVMKLDHVYHTYPQAASLILPPHQLAGGIPLVSRPIPSAPQMIPGAMCNPTGLPTGDGSTTLSDATSISASTTLVSDTTATDTDTGDTLSNTIAEDLMVMDSINNSVPI